MQPGDPDYIGPYRLIRELGSGGMGRVFLARSGGGRPVAVKVIRPDLAADPEFRVRFQHEVAAARKVNGLYTAVVVDADVDGPMPWLATAYVAGPSLADKVRLQGPMDAAAVAVLGAGLAEGLGAIHAAGLVHRDLKPSNVLLADDGPRVIDFGISRAVEASALTSTGLVVGSPGFMSPEQAVGGDVGPSSDVFSLGALLTFASTGHGPFGTGSAPALGYRVVHAAPNLDGVPTVIRPLVERCLAKDPVERPAIADLVAELGDPEVPEDWLSPGHTGNLAPDADADVAEDHAPEPEPSPPRTLTAQPGPAFAPTESRAAPGLQLASAAPGIPRPARARRRRPAVIAAGAGTIVAAAIATVLLTLPGASAAGHHQPPAPSGSTPPTVPPATPYVTLADPGSKGAAAPIAFSPDGGTFAVVDDNGSTYLWNTATGKLTATLTDPGGQGAGQVAFSPDGGTLAVADRNGIHLWNTATGKLTATLTDPDGNADGVLRLMFLSGGSILAVVNANSTTYLWNTATGKLTAIRRYPGQTVQAVSPDGNTIATGSTDQGSTLYLRNTLTSTVTGVIPGQGSNFNIVLSPGGGYGAENTGATQPTNTVPLLWNTANGKPVALQGPSILGPFSTITFSPDARTLADTGDGDGDSTYLWNTATGKLTATLTDPDGDDVYHAAFSSGGTVIATTETGGSIDLWNTATGKLIAKLPSPTSYTVPENATDDGYFWITFSSKGTLAAAEISTGSVYLWNTGAKS